MMQSIVHKSAVDITELLVLWQQPSTRAMIPVAILSFDGDLYRFKYLEDVSELEGFRALLGFRDFKLDYESDELFPLFQERVLDPARPDYERVVHELELGDGQATPWEQLIRTGGTSEGDTIQVTPFPRPSGEGWECVFLAAGLRYFQEKSVKTDRGISETYTRERFEGLLSALSPGDELDVVLEAENAYNPNAQLLFYGNDVVGYLPDWLARLTITPIEGGSSVVGKIVRVNETGAGWHLRLMVVVSSDEPFSSVNARLRAGQVLRY